MKVIQVFCTHVTGSVVVRFLTAKHRELVRGFTFWMTQDFFRFVRQYHSLQLSKMKPYLHYHIAFYISIDSSCNCGSIDDIVVIIEGFFVTLKLRTYQHVAFLGSRFFVSVCVKHYLVLELCKLKVKIHNYTATYTSIDSSCNCDSIYSYVVIVGSLCIALQLLSNSHEIVGDKKEFFSLYGVVALNESIQNKT